MNTDSKFITNAETKKLKKRLVELINNSKELKFLVGFFYFSGIRELYDGLKNRDNLEIKVLVGLDVDKHIHGLVEYAEDRDDLSDREKVERFFDSLGKSINSDNFDRQEFYEQVRFFIKLIKEDKLIIRKTCRPNHAKLYIFKLKEPVSEVKKIVFITGSSNLTMAGLTTQEEFNVEISDYGTENAEEFFDKLWNEPAVKITEDENFKKKLIEIVETETLVAEVTPFEAFALILKTYLDSQSQKEVEKHLVNLMVEKDYKPYKYQLDAVSQALSIIENYNGVIISDVVGLGKSVIASMVAKSMGKRGVIICRPGIIGDPDKKDSGWHKYKEDFKLYDWEIRSSGKLEDVLELVKNNEDFEIVIIDEAHNFRNQDTEDYEMLSDICRNKIVILLTATPFNNSPGDIFSLLKLFVIPGKSKITLDDDLDLRFRNYKKTFQKLSFINKNHRSPDSKKAKKAQAYYESLFGSNVIELDKVKARAKYLSNRMRAVIEPVVIRRNRIDLQKDPKYSEEAFDLPVVKDPCEIFFTLSKEQSEFYDRVIYEYFGEGGRFTGAIYRPYEYEEEFEADVDENEEVNKKNLEKNRERLIQRNLYDFMRRLLVKRFESSFGAFNQSLKNFYDITEKVQKFINKSNKYILDRKLLGKIYQSDLEEIEKELVKFAEKLENIPHPNPKTHKIYEVNKFKKKREFLNDIESDKRLFSEILKELEKLNLVKNDPKPEELAKEIKKIFKEETKAKKRKVVIFTEYIDTAAHLESKIKTHFPDRVLTVKGNLSQSKEVQSILTNFDAIYKHQKDDYDILIATDRISEGFNLNRAGAVINYDIPWNPTRVIQRVGRINRISKKVFDNLFIYNFFPTEQGADVVRSRQIASEKMFLIHNTLGEDVKIFDSDETPTASKLYNKIMQNPEKIETESFFTKIRQKYYEIRNNNPELIDKISKLPPRVKSAKKFNKYNLTVFIRKGLSFFVKGLTETDEKVQELTLEETYNYIECEKNEKLLPLSNKFWDNYENIKNYKERFHTPTSEQSVERKATINLKYIISNPQENLIRFLPFLRILLEDIIDYKTLPIYRMRRIANLKANSKSEKEIKFTIEELKKLKDDLGENYLNKIKSNLGELNPEIIVAVENRA